MIDCGTLFFSSSAHKGLGSILGGVAELFSVSLLDTRHMGQVAALSYSSTSRQVLFITWMLPLLKWAWN